MKTLSKNTRKALNGILNRDEMRTCMKHGYVSIYQYLEWKKVQKLLRK